MKEQTTTHLKFFGIGRILPFLKHVRNLIFVMVFFGLAGSATDIILPQFQRYALDHYIANGVFDTIGIFVFLYILTLLAAAGSTFPSNAPSKVPSVQPGTATAMAP